VGVDGVGEPGGDGVEFAADEQRWLGERRAVPCGEVLPVPVNVAVAVEGSGQPGAFELGRVEVQVGFGEPAGRRAGGELVGELAAGRDDEGVTVGGLAGEGGVDSREPGADVGFDLGLGPAGRLEVGDVELPRAADPGVGVGGPVAAAGGVGDAEQGDGGEDVGPQQRGVGGDG
jgi:hypothetical protein